MVSLSHSVLAKDIFWEYTFRPGDSLWKIAQKYTTSVNNWKEIQKINQLRQGGSRKIQIGSRIMIPVSMLKAQPVPARVIATSDALTLFRANGTKIELSVGTLMYSGDRVVTDDNQVLRIEFADHSQLQVLPNSEVVIDKLSQHKESGMFDTQIRLNSGRINTQVEKQNKNSLYKIITPSAVTAVRGTAFRMSSRDSSISRTEVTEGLVNVFAGNYKKPVKEGFGIIAEKGKPLSDPIKLLPPPILLLNQSDHTRVTKISWQKQKGANDYRYQLSDNNKFSRLIKNITTQNNKVEINNLDPGHYYFRVRGIDKYQLEGINSINDFIILELKQDNDLIKNVILPTQILLLN